jgi:hypothetical protein
MPVILAAWETEIKRIMAQGQLRKKKMCARPHLHGKKLGILVNTCHPSYDSKCAIGGPQYRPTWTKSKRLSPK